MDFIDWCDLVFDTLVEAAAASPTARRMGANVEQDLLPLLFKDVDTRQPEFHSSKARLGTYDALQGLARIGLVEERHGTFFKPASGADQFASDRTSFWHEWCGEELKEDQAQLLRAVNLLSPQTKTDHAWTERVEHGALLNELDWPDGFDQLLAVAQELEEVGFVRGLQTMGAIEVEATYPGLVWEHRRGFTIESKFIDSLVAEWETTSVEFKRELHTDTADQKAELVKDLIALANTQASGQRWLIVGFDDKTSAYHGPPDPKINQEHLEQLISLYTDPFISLRYESVDYRAGQVGKLEVLRDPQKLPHRVAKAIGNNKRIEQGQVFVRHGSIVEEPTDGELKAMEEEARRASSS